MHRALGVALVFAVALGGCGTGAGQPAPSSAPDYTGHTVHLGAVFSLSGPGQVLGDPETQGVALAVEAVNRAGGINGGQVAVDLKDDASTPQQSADAFTKEINDTKVLGLIGPSLAIAAPLAHPVASKARTPVIATSLIGSGFTGQCAYPCAHVYRDSLGEAVAIPDNVKTLVQKSHPHTALVLYSNDDTLSTADAKLLQNALADNGVQVLDGGLVAVPKATSSVSDLVTAALAKKADAWSIATPGGLAAQLMTEARKQGFKGPFTGGNSFNSPGVSRLAAGAGVGAESATAYFAGLDLPVNHEFISAYRAKYKDADGKPQDPDITVAQAYSAVLLFAAAAKRASLTFDNPAADRDRLDAALSGVSADTPMGTVSLTAQGDVRQPVYVVAMDGKGGFILVDTYPPR